ncbi:ATP-dependent DNA ligase [Hyphomicrobium sp. 2TAF46]|uniref:ATP-dependent DNA ligase n=1 Tax=Hyphomicrobium sp. 2TAF46 TaxID=3233019 RepID=UPI003F925F18
MTLLVPGSGGLRERPEKSKSAAALVVPARRRRVLHEVKFDGWRAQIHLEDGDAAIFSQSGADLTKRFRALLGG